MRPALAALAALAGAALACGGRTTPPAAPSAPAPTTTAERVLGLLPDGVQLVVELDLARLRANPVVGDLATQVLAELGAEARIPGLPLAVQGSPLAEAELVVLAAYGVGTPGAAAITLLVTRAELGRGTRLSSDLIALGPDDWTGQIAARAAIAGHSPDAPLAAVPGLGAARDLLDLRDRAMPRGAAGAVLRLTARLPFDARVALARQTGLEAAPAQLSVWADVVDDLALIVDADGDDPADRAERRRTRRGGAAARRMTAVLRELFAGLAAEPVVRALGLGRSLSDARFVEQGTWTRAILAVGPRHLARVTERARAMLAPAS
jgi:hypothetical protein